MLWCDVQTIQFRFWIDWRFYIEGDIRRCVRRLSVLISWKEEFELHADHPVIFNPFTWREYYGSRYWHARTVGAVWRLCQTSLQERVLSNVTDLYTNYWTKKSRTECTLSRLSQRPRQKSVNESNSVAWHMTWRVIILALFGTRNVSKGIITSCLLFLCTRGSSCGYSIVSL